MLFVLGTWQFSVKETKIATVAVAMTMTIAIAVRYIYYERRPVILALGECTHTVLQIGQRHPDDMGVSEHRGTLI